MSNCVVKLKNTGRKGCEITPKAGKLFILVPKFGADGSLNSLPAEGDANGKWDADDLFGKVSNALPGQDNSYNVFYPLPQMEDVVPTPEDPEYKTYSSGRKTIVKTGVTSLAAILVGGSYDYLRALKPFECVALGFYEVDLDGSLIGKSGPAKAGVEQIYPILIAEETLLFKPLRAKEGESTHETQMSFDIKATEKDEDVVVIPSNEMVSSYGSLLDIVGMLDIEGEILGATTTTLTVKVFSRFGSLINFEPDAKLLLSNLGAYNNTDDAAIALDSFTEDAPGTYTLTFLAAQDLGDSISPNFTGNAYPGKDYTAVNELSIVIS